MYNRNNDNLKEKYRRERKGKINEEREQKNYYEKRRDIDKMKNLPIFLSQYWELRHFDCTINYLSCSTHKLIILDENIIGGSKMRNNFFVAYQMLNFSLLRLTSLLLFLYWF